ncbi:hypothetical protein [Demetria terragena]|uniref:hypothetical protein n=1 Tax=Demetria terragena TaxID=63959 RepID=UPI00035C3C9F|nr:hypothetical protein [Demetria terragena]
MNINRSLTWGFLLVAIGVYGIIRAEELVTFQGIAAMVALACGIATLAMTLRARQLQQKQRR